MQTKFNSLLLLFSCSIIFASCSNSFPSGFWENFHEELITKNESNQGALGGTLKIHWKAKSTESFSENELLDFAAKNDWTQVDSFIINENITNDSTYIKLRRDDYSFELLRSEVLTKEKFEGWKLIIFKTPWMLVDLKDTGETFENGFALLNPSKTELKIIHFWGE
ncbi:MAG: hypothetical protein ACKO7D_11985 [Bacteroidota bacterium]